MPADSCISDNEINVSSVSCETITAVTTATPPPPSPSPSPLPIKKSEKLTEEKECMKRMVHNTKVLNELKPGDLVQYRRDLYSHWAVYAGHDKVIHLHGNTEGRFSGVGVLSSNFGLAEVKIDHFWDILQNSYAYRNNSRDSELTPLTSNEIVFRAYSKIGSDFYDLFTYNCEHFANWCRYDLPISEQTTRIIQFGTRVTHELRNFQNFCKQLFTKQIEDEDSLYNTMKNQISNNSNSQQHETAVATVAAEEEVTSTASNNTNSSQPARI